MPNAVVSLQLQSQVAPQIAATANAYKSLSAEEKKAEQAATAYAQALTKVALADAKTATEEQRLAVQTANAAKAQTQAEQAALRLANAQQKAAGGNSFAAETAQAFGSQLTSMLGPAALAAGAIGLLVNTANSFKEAFSFKAQLDQTTASIEVQLRGVRNSSQVFDQAAQFANTYKLTTQETTDAIRASIPVMRASQASTQDILGTLSRLRVLNPEQDFAGAARALAELKAGQVTSIVDRFNIARSAANAMKQEIEGGGDAVLVLSKYLDSAGVGMDALKAGATGASGTLRDLAKAEEDLKIAQGELAAGPGAEAVRGRTLATQQLTIVLALLTGNYNTAAQAAQRAGEVTAESNFRGGSSATGWALATQRLAKAHQETAEAMAAVTVKTYDQVAAFDEDRIAIGKLQLAAQQALPALQAVAGGAAPNQGKHINDRTVGAVGGLGAALTKAGNQAAAQAKTADQEAARLQDARDSLALSRAKTSAQKIAELRRQQAASDDPVKKLQLQQQIEQEQDSAAKTHTAELNKQLNLHESIYDSLNKQRDAQLDIEELTIRDRMQDRADAQKIKTANAILASPTASADLKARAQDALDLISVSDRKRAQELAEKGATAGGAIIGGKVYQSSAGGAPPGGLPPGGGAGTAGPLPSAGGAQGAAGAGAQGPLTINLVVDGKTLASVSEPYIMDALLKAVRGARATAGA